MKKFLSSQSFQIYYLPILFFAVCFIWRFFYITERDICLDEPFTIYNAQKSIGDIILLTIHGEPTPPLFMLLVHFWIKFFGLSAMALRTLPLLISSLTLVFIYRSSYKIAGIYAALITSILFLFSSLHFYYALEVRTYSLVSLFTAIIYYLFIVLIQNEQKKYLLFYIVLANIGLLMTNYFGALVIANEVFFLLFYFKNKILRKKILLILISTLVFSFPIIYLLVKQYAVSSQGTWISPMGEGQYQHFIYFFLNDGNVAKIIEYILLIGTIVFIYNMVKKYTNLSILKLPLLILLCFVFRIQSCMFFLSNRLCLLIVISYSILFHSLYL
jgi:uncharacterized membrane protein